ncbi:MAG: preprotein translocase subunit YajC [Alphaproteobacteria bacterium]|nr:preprotein translocase subunit YajC [Alphaproteobacteria bacterium]MBV8548617.1 preprotein translocase subunit YajC [Alphaproteobacteria bacterium]
MQFLPLVLIFAVFYFLIIRPQQKKMDQHQSMLKAIQKGDKVVTGGGIVGTVHKLDGDDHLSVEIAEGVRVKIVRSSISSVLNKDEKAKETSSPAVEAKN